MKVHTEAVSVPSNSAMIFCIKVKTRNLSKNTPMDAEVGPFADGPGAPGRSVWVLTGWPQSFSHTQETIPPPCTPPSLQSPLSPSLPVKQGVASSRILQAPGRENWAQDGPWGPCLLIPLSCSGQSGLGKSTLVNTLFKSQVSRKASSWNREEKIPKTVEIKAIGHGEGPAGTPGTGQRASARKAGEWGLVGSEAKERQPRYRIKLSPKLYGANSSDCKARGGRRRG